ncbi:MAG: hypothetical protein ACRELY_17290, partial [Polyangiaceae bacterium]
RKLADTIGEHGTPTIYINGREFDPHTELEDWIQTELAIAPHGAPQPEVAAGDAGASAAAKDAGKDSGKTAAAAGGNAAGAGSNSSKPH